MKEKVLSEINIVPYVDVMLVLLVIFMLASPIILKTVDIQVPDAGDSSVIEKVNEDIVIVSVLMDGTLKIGDNEVSMINIKEKIDTGSVINLAADENMKYGDLMSVMLSFKDSGYKNVSLVIQD